VNAYEEKLRDRFWKKVKKIKNGCWEWVGATTCGYGRIGVCGKTVIAHRLSWVWANGKIPKGLCVLHKCDNRPCVNPKHLFLGTKKDNTRDCIRKGRFGDTGPTSTRLRTSDGFVKCCKCEKFLPKESFHKDNKVKSHSCHSCCKRCQSEYKRERRAEVKEKAKR